MTWLPTFLKTERNLSVLNSGGYLAVIILQLPPGLLGAKIDRRADTHRAHVESLLDAGEADLVV